MSGFFNEPFPRVGDKVKILKAPAGVRSMTRWVRARRSRPRTWYDLMPMNLDEWCCVFTCPFIKGVSMPLPQLTSHRVNGCNEALVIEVVDEPGSGGANHRYDISGFDIDSNPSKDPPVWSVPFTRLPILFQNGPIQPGQIPNGVTNEALLAVLIDRLTKFEGGPFACFENDLALMLLIGAQRMLKYRTEQRVQRGVEGTYAQ